MKHISYGQKAQKVEKKDTRTSNKSQIYFYV